MQDISRRYFLGLAGTAFATVSLGPWLPRLTAQDAPGTDTPNEATDAPATPAGKTLVVIFLRGGVDGLNMVVPHGDPHYAALRPSIGLLAPTRNEATARHSLALDDFFGLHPRMSALHGLYEQGELAVVHAVGNPRNNRSHFAMQDHWETLRLNGSTTGVDGWLNRHLQTSVGNGPLRAVSIGSAMPRILRGEARVQVLNSVSDLAYTNRYGDADAITDRLRALYDRDRSEDADAPGEGDMSADPDVRERLEETSRDTLEGLRELESLANEAYEPAEAASYPDGNALAGRLRDVAQLIKAGVGLEVVQVDVGGWDTHQNQGSAGGGAYGNRVNQLSEAIAAFWRDLGEERKQDVMVLTLTEFGRTARENGTRGTDHGHASCMLALGGAFATAGTGGQVHVRDEWPGLGPDELNQRRDLKITTDFRDVIGEVVRDHLGNPHLDQVLEGHELSQLGLLADRAIEEQTDEADSDAADPNPDAEPAADDDSDA